MRLYILLLATVLPMAAAQSLDPGSVDAEFETQVCGASVCVDEGAVPGTEDPESDPGTGDAAEDGAGAEAGPAADHGAGAQAGPAADGAAPGEDSRAAEEPAPSGADDRVAPEFEAQTVWAILSVQAPCVWGKQDRRLESAHAA